MNVLTKIQQALLKHTIFNGHKRDGALVSVWGDDGVTHLLEYDAGVFTLSDLRTLVSEYAELKHHMEGLEK